MKRNLSFAILLAGGMTAVGILNVPAQAADARTANQAVLAALMPSCCDTPPCPPVCSPEQIAALTPMQRAAYLKSLK